MAAPYAASLSVVLDLWPEGATDYALGLSGVCCSHGRSGRGLGSRGSRLSRAVGLFLRWAVAAGRWELLLLIPNFRLSPISVPPGAERRRELRDSVGATLRTDDGGASWPADVQLIRPGGLVCCADCRRPDARARTVSV